MKTITKFTIKAISMILMLAMTLSVTAMAANYNGTAATYETSENYHAYRDYKIAAYGEKDTPPTAELEKIADPTYSNYYKQLDDYRSPIGDPIATYAYIRANFAEGMANAWVTSIYRAARPCICFKNRQTVCTCDRTAAYANDYLNYLLTGTFDSDFVAMQNIYGNKIAEKFSGNVCCVLTDDDKKQTDWTTFRADYIKATTEFNEDGTYSKLTVYNEYGVNDNLIPLDVIAAVNAFVTPLADAISIAITTPNGFSSTTIGFSKEALYNVLYQSNLYPLDHEKSVTNGHTISTDEAVRIAKNILMSDDPNMGSYNPNSKYESVAAAISEARNGKTVSVFENKIVDNKNIIPTTNVTITVDGKPATMEAIILNNTTYFKARDLAAVMDGRVSWDDWYSTGPDGRPSEYLGSGVGVYPNKLHTTSSDPAPLSPAETRDSRVSIVTVNRNIQLEAIVLTNEFGGATTYFKIRDIAAILHYNVNWNATTGISVSAK